MDAQRSLLEYIWGVLTADTALKAAMGGAVRLYPVWANVDAAFPYLVQRIDIRPGIPYPRRAGVYYLDIWSDSPNANEILDIRNRIIGLLDELQFNTTDVKNCRFMLQTDGFIPESEFGIWHYATMWNLNLWRQTEFTTIDGR